MSLRVEPNDQDEKLWAYLHRAGLKLTNNRRTILAVFFAGTEPVTTTDLWLQTKKADPRTSYATVWTSSRPSIECGRRDSSTGEDAPWFVKVIIPIAPAPEDLWGTPPALAGILTATAFIRESWKPPQDAMACRALRWRVG